MEFDVNKVMDRIDPKGHVVLGRFDNRAVLFCPENEATPFVNAYGYDEATGNWSQGQYSSNPSTVWNAADPAIVAKLCLPVTWKFLETLFDDAGYMVTRGQLESFVDSVEACLWHEEYQQRYTNDDIASWLFGAYADDHGFRKCTDTCANCTMWYSCPDSPRTGFCTQDLSWHEVDEEPCNDFECIDC